jgi:hypothetical protein
MMVNPLLRGLGAGLGGGGTATLGITTTALTYVAIRHCHKNVRKIVPVSKHLLMNMCRGIGGNIHAFLTLVLDGDG